MIRRSFGILAFAIAGCSTPAHSPAPLPAPGAAPSVAQPAPRPPERAVRRDIPLTNMIRRAFEAGTRDSTGRPGRNYWQLRTDYTINARLDPATQTITGRETVVIHNNGPVPMDSIALRLDPNIFRPNVPHAAPSIPSEVTDGMVISRLAVNGQDRKSVG